eukprot:m.46894 g.46894  ORF g.46894 m.46894 type:complete len:516 (-) comp11197_c1_seq1:65-1612(-)
MQRKRPKGSAGDEQQLVMLPAPTRPSACEPLLKVYEDAILHLQEAAACLSNGSPGSPNEEFFQHFADFGFALNKLLVTEQEALPKQCLRFLQASYEQNYITAHSKPSNAPHKGNTAASTKEASCSPRPAPHTHGQVTVLCESETGSPRRARSVSVSPRPRKSLCDLARMPQHVGAGSVYNSKERAASENAQLQEQERRTQAIEETIYRQPSRRVTFDDIAGHATAKSLLKEAVVLPFVYPHLFTNGRQPWRCILLHGPPGTGKTRLAQAVAHEVHGTFYSVSSANLVSSWVGESEKLIRELFAHARRQKGCAVIFIDELDSLCRRRSEREEEHTRRIKTELLRQMDGVEEVQQGQLFVLGATNCPWELDSAFLRRFQKRVYLPLPDLETRISLLSLKVKESKECIDMTIDHVTELAGRLEGFSGSDIVALFADALFEPVRELVLSTNWVRADDAWVPAPAASTKDAVTATLQELPPTEVRARPVRLADFLSVLSRNPPATDPAEVARHNDFARVG